MKTWWSLKHYFLLLFVMDQISIPMIVLLVKINQSLWKPNSSQKVTLSQYKQPGVLEEGLISKFQNRNKQN